MFPLDPIIRQKFIVSDRKIYNNLVDIIIAQNDIAEQIKTISVDIKKHIKYGDAFDAFILCDEIIYKTKIINGFTIITYEIIDVQMENYELESGHLYTLLKNLDKPLARYDHTKENGQLFKLDDFIYCLRTDDFYNFLIHVDTINKFREKMNGLICLSVD
jgi:hypothetical protein